MSALGTGLTYGSSTRAVGLITSFGGCMLNEVAIAVVTRAAGDIIAYVPSGRMDALRIQVARISRHAIEQENGPWYSAD